MSMNEADLVAAALRAQEAGQVRQVEPEKRQPEGRGGKPGEEERKAGGKRTDFFERTAPPEEGAEPDDGTADTPTHDEEPQPEEGPGKHIDALA